METSDFATGQVVVVPFPYADQLAEKRRPALVVSNHQLAKSHGLIWVVMITSAKNSSRDDNIALPLEGTGLSAPSVIRTAKIATLETSRIVRIAGKVPEEVLNTVLQQVRGQLGRVE